VRGRKVNTGGGLSLRIAWEIQGVGVIPRITGRGSHWRKPAGTLGGKPLSQEACIVTDYKGTEAKEGSY